MYMNVISNVYEVPKALEPFLALLAPGMLCSPLGNKKRHD
jgi:hypothetical protein